MKDVERFLEKGTLARTPERLEGRMEGLFAAPPVRPRRFLARPVALWQCVAACALCCAAGFFATRLAQDPVVPGPVTRYVTERIYYVPGPEAGYRNAFDGLSVDEPARFVAPVAAPLPEGRI